MDIVENLYALKVILITIIFLSILIEIKTGGMGFGTMIGVIAAAIFWISSYLSGAISIYYIAIFLVGILFLTIELFAPATGLFAAVGIIMMLYSITLGLGGDIFAIYTLLGSLVLSIIIFILIIKKLPSSRLWQKITLKNSSTKENGYTSSPDNSALVHKKGTALTELRPAGTVLIDNSPVDAISEGSYIVKGKNIEVINVEGNRIIVRQID